MAENERRLAAIMFTDVAGFTRLTQGDESETIRRLEDHRRLVRPILASHGGREIKTIGDAFLVEFKSALDAVLCSVAIQQVMHDQKVARAWTLSLRIGIHVGDVVESGSDILGDAVNIASRIEPLAEPGGVCISGHVHDQVMNKSDLPFVSLGQKSLKNVTAPVEVYRMVMPWEREAGPSSAASSDKKRVAVLPFTNLSSNPEEGYFADGITEEIITSLSGVRQLAVIARTSVMGYKGTTKKVKEIGRELEAGTVLEGSVRKAGNRVRIAAQLIDTATETHLWAQNYDRNLDDIFAVQSEIAEKVAGELKVQLLQEEKKTLERKPTENMEAYNDFLRAKELYREGSEPSLRQALKLFEEAIQLDPSFARAHVGIAECHQNLGNAGYEPRDVMLTAVKAALKRALELDPDLAEAHSSVALLHMHEDDMEGQEAEARRALELNPSLPEAYQMLYEAAGFKGESEEMVKDIEAAYRLDPIRPNYIYLLGFTYFMTGREQEALEHWKKTEHLAPAATYQNMTDYYLSKGDLPKARELHAKVEQLRPTSAWVMYMGGFIDATAGEREEALEAIRKIEERNMGATAYNYVAYIYHALGDMDRYFENMNKALEGHVLFANFVMYSPLLAKSREDRRYGELVGKMRRMNGLAN